MTFITKKDPPIDVWCLIRVPGYCESGFVVAKHDGDFWTTEAGDEIVVNNYVNGWKIIEE